MNEKFKTLIVNDCERKISKLCVEAEKHGLGLHVVGACESMNQAEGALHIYDPEMIIVGVDSAGSGLEFAQKLARDGFDGMLFFYGTCVELEIVCSALPRSGCAFVHSEDDDRAIEKIKHFAGFLAHNKRMRRAVDSIFLGAPQITKEYFSRLLAGDDSEYLRLQIGVLGINPPSAGCVIYGKTINPLNTEHAEKCFAKLSEALDGDSFGDFWRDCFITVTSEKDEHALKNLIKPTVDEIAAAGGEFIIGISEFSPEKHSLKEAVKAAKILVGDNVFMSSCGVYTDSENAVVHSGKCRRLVGDALKLIGEHYSEKISAEWAARQLFVSSSHLMHEFKKSLGSTFNDCLKKYRTMRAKELLSSGNYRVNEVARAVGFSDARYFGMVFKGETGISPGEFIKQSQDSPE